MKSTGMVRRIDALGRVVIPKEIRKTMKIQDNDPLEIFIDNDQVIFKRYSTILALESVSQQIVEILYQQQNTPVMVCDMDKVVAISGIPKKEVINRPISLMFVDHIKTCKPYIYKDKSQSQLLPIDSDKRFVIASTSIVINGFPVGAIAFLSEDEKSIQTATDIDISLIQAFASCLANQLPSI